MDLVSPTSVILCLHSSCFTFWHLGHSFALTGFCFSSCSHLWLLNGAGESPDFSPVPNSSNQTHLHRFGFGFYFWLMTIVIPALLSGDTYICKIVSFYFFLYLFSKVFLLFSPSCCADAFCCIFNCYSTV